MFSDVLRSKLSKIFGDKAKEFDLDNKVPLVQNPDRTIEWVLIGGLIGAAVTASTANHWDYQAIVGALLGGSLGACASEIGAALEQ